MHDDAERLREAVRELGRVLWRDRWQAAIVLGGVWVLFLLYAVWTWLR